MLGARTAQGLPATDGRGRVQRGLHREHQRAQGYERDPGLRCGGEQGPNGDRGHGEDPGSIPGAG